MSSEQQISRAWITGVGMTRFGRIPESNTQQLQASVGRAAINDAGIECDEVDGLLVGYATTTPHLMPANVLAEVLGLQPKVATGMSVGGATGLAMVAQAARLVATRAVRHVVITSGENRATGQSTSESMGVLSGVGHPDYESPLGMTIPAYYALLASSYLHEHSLGPEALAPLAVQMREHAARHPGAHFRSAITASDVLESRPVADPLRLLDCCPVSDGAAAIVVSGEPVGPGAAEIVGIGSANQHQHLSAASDPMVGARNSANEALQAAMLAIDDVEYAGVYDSFTVTLAMLLESIGLAAPGKAGVAAAAGDFDLCGRVPVNTHGGLLSFGHSGVAGGLAHLVEGVQQLRGSAGSRQVRRPGEGTGARAPRTALFHGDGGVMSAHTTMILRSERTVVSDEYTEHSLVMHNEERRQDWTTGSATLMLDCCSACGQHHYLPVIACAQCGHDLFESVRSTGVGTVVAVTRVQRPIEKTAPPFDVGIVALEEGPRLMGRVAGPAVQIGERVQVSFATDDNATTLPILSTIAPDG